MTVAFRRATRADMPAIVALLADDELGSGREVVTDPLPAAYGEAFEAIAADPRQLLVVGDDGGTVRAVLQITFIPGLTFVGGERALIEAVRVDRSVRGEGVGHALMTWAIDRAKERGCRLVQLTSNQRRPDAHRFYESLGFAPTHTGYKLWLGDH